MIYLASPYTHKDPFVEAERAKKTAKKAAQLASMGFQIYAPIVHGVGILPFLSDELSKNKEFWMDQCLAMLRHCDVMFVYMLNGWDISDGVAIEIDFCKQNDIPISYIY